MIQEGTNHILKEITDLITKSNDAMNKHLDSQQEVITFMVVWKIQHCSFLYKTAVFHQDAVIYITFQGNKGLKYKMPETNIHFCT